ncbi:hypothetical protein [Chitinivibrio alkaliphilus]|uniref:Uncharacterized protein n=1 Tax=Chitinivibrio alkaliphilus ACht1 TaxID=1313304 RepID=U7D577_9BACT|nr:hypothetical protein [Chitinivibrio alkaliphilus]ERP31098.1 hypothetical protein CALK_2061 [Chitinivibrio alkaliphilus ACht1]
MRRVFALLCGPAHGANLFLPKKLQKDFANGLIGQAWAIEGLLAVYEERGEEKYLTCAEEVFLLHPFKRAKKAWHIVNVDGSHAEIDPTFNHQLWFAAAGALIWKHSQNHAIKSVLDLFFANLSRAVRTSSTGRIQHSLHRPKSLKERIVGSLTLLKRTKARLVAGQSMLYKEQGYHLFNLYAFALIYSNGFDSLPFWDSPLWKKALSYSFSSTLLSDLEKNNHSKDVTALGSKQTELSVNRYGYAYNAPGFELPYIYSVFSSFLTSKEKEIMLAVQKKQIDFTYDSEQGCFGINTEDARTLTARIYELTRYLSFGFEQRS